MFSSKHEIWKFALAGDELDDWLPYAEDLVNEWRNDTKVTFNNSWDIILASYLLMDDLLPPIAKKAFANIKAATALRAHVGAIVSQYQDNHPLFDRMAITHHGQTQRGGWCSMV